MNLNLNPNFLIPSSGITSKLQFLPHRQVNSIYSQLSLTANTLTKLDLFLGTVVVVILANLEPVSVHLNKWKYTTVHENFNHLFNCCSA